MLLVIKGILLGSAALLFLLIAAGWWAGRKAGRGALRPRLLAASGKRFTLRHHGKNNFSPR